MDDIEAPIVGQCLEPPRRQSMRQQTASVRSNVRSGILSRKRIDDDLVPGCNDSSHEAPVVPCDPFCDVKDAHLPNSLFERRPRQVLPLGDGGAQSEAKHLVKVVRLDAIGWRRSQRYELMLLDPGSFRKLNSGAQAPPLDNHRFGFVCLYPLQTRTQSQFKLACPIYHLSP